MLMEMSSHVKVVVYACKLFRYLAFVFGSVSIYSFGQIGLSGAFLFFRQIRRTMNLDTLFGRVNWLSTWSEWAAPYTCW